MQRIIDFLSVRYTGRTGPAVAAGLLLFAVVLGPVVLFPDLPIQLPVPTSALGIAAVIALVICRFEAIKPPAQALALAGFFLTVFYLSSDLLLRPHGFVHRAFPYIIFSFLTVLFALTDRFFRSDRFRRITAIGLLGATSAAGIFGYLSVSGGNLIFSDDHPCFLYRLIQLKEHFPDIPFYNPLWNGGVEAREFFPSGALNIFFLYLPLIYLFDVTSIYSGLVVSFIFFVVPFFAFSGARIAGYDSKTAVLSATLALASSIFWYRWTLSYGTMGFAVSAALVLLNLPLIACLLDRSKPESYRLAGLFAVTATLMLLWSPAALLVLPVAIWSLSKIKLALTRRSLLLTAVLLLILNLPWMIIFAKVSRVGDFVAVASKPAAESSTIEQPQQSAAELPRQFDPSKFKIADPAVAAAAWPQRAVTIIRENALSINPLLLFFGVAGLILLRSRTEQIVFGLTAASAGLLGIFGPIIRPQLELERMFMVLAVILTLPAAAAISRLFEPQATARTWILIRSTSRAALLLLPLWIWNVASNQTEVQFSTAGPEVFEFSKELAECGGDGRALFAGFTLHELGARYIGKSEAGGGHVAPLAAWTSRPLIASSYQHDRWRYTDVVPKDFRDRKDEGVAEYLNLMNVSCVVAHDRFWRRWYSSRTNDFEQLGETGRFTLFSRKNYTSNYFLEGRGQILKQDGDRVELRVDSPMAVVKFNYFPFLTAGSCKIAPAPQSGSIVFVRLIDCPVGDTIVLKAEPIWSRIF